MESYGWQELPGMACGISCRAGPDVWAPYIWERRIRPLLGNNRLGFRGGGFRFSSLLAITEPQGFVKKLPFHSGLRGAKITLDPINPRNP